MRPLQNPNEAMTTSLIASRRQQMTEAIKNRMAITVSDGSYKRPHGTAAFIIEGYTSENRIVGKVITPGNAEDQSPYKSELAGILAALIITNIICEHHEIKEGGIELACDGLSALHKAFLSQPYASIFDPNYDLISAIHREHENSPLTWKHKHVKGHQDDHNNISLLDHWSKLNIEVDTLAKAHLNIAPQITTHQNIANEPWSLWVNGRKLTKSIMATIYDWIHALHAREYWISRDRCKNTTFDLIHWDNIARAMRETPRQRRVFISNQLVCAASVNL